MSGLCNTLVSNCLFAYLCASLSFIYIFFCIFAFLLFISRTDSQILNLYVACISTLRAINVKENVNVAVNVLCNILRIYTSKGITHINITKTNIFITNK
jgi:hypothetical protein